MKSINLVFILLIILTACQKVDDENVGNTIILQDVDANYLDFGPCFYGSSAFDSIVIQNQAAYLTLEDSLRYGESKECEDASLPLIDFSQYTLIGKWTGASGCYASYERRIVKKFNAQTYLYQIKVTSHGLCEMLISDMNWAVIPQIPPGWKVEFEVSYEFSDDK